uniref:Tetratricopeptide repeat protein n=1 Tax=Ascaris lumbricoides TaxID=6252 RepID=A0A0M3ISU7_ASCLU
MDFVSASTAYRPVLTKLTRCGWRVQLIHPENTPKEIVEQADESCSLETILGGDVGENNATVDYPNTAYFALGELGRADAAIEMLNNVAEQYESKVIYFNERAAEAVIELKAFDVER